MSRVAMFALALVAAPAAWAAPTVMPLDGPDKHGATNYSVRCENGGGRKIVQCVRDTRHCGYGGDQTLEEAAVRACGGGAEPAPTAPPMETSPAMP